MEALRQVASGRFLHRLSQHLEISCSIDRGRLKRELPKAIQAAAELRITRECDVVRYCEITYGNLDSYTVDSLPPEAQNIVFAYGVDAEQRLGRLERWISEHAGQEFKNV